MDEVEGVLDAFLRATPDTFTAIDAEVQSMCTHEGVPVILARMLVDGASRAQIRQLAGSLIRTQVIEKHWTRFTEEERSEVRSILLQGLRGEFSWLRTACARALGAISENDFPSTWPGFLEEVGKVLDEGGVGVDGGMRCLVFFTARLSGALAADVFRAIGPSMLESASSGDLDGRSRARALRVVQQLIDALHQAFCRGGEGGEEAESVLSETVNYIVRISVSVLEESMESSLHSLPAAACARRALGVLSSLAQLFPFALGDMGEGLVDAILSASTKALGAFVEGVVEGGMEGEEVEGGGDGYDSEDDGVSESPLSAVLLKVCVFFETILPVWEEQETLCEVICDPKLLVPLAKYTLVVSQLPNSAAAEWEDDPAAYVDQEDEEPAVHTPRGAAASLMSVLVRVLREDAVRAVLRACEDVVESTGEEGKAGYAWKMHEVVLRGIGVVAPAAAAVLADGDSEVDWEQYILTAIEPRELGLGVAASVDGTSCLSAGGGDGDIAADPLVRACIRARALWAGSRLSKILSSHASEELAHAAIVSLDASAPLPERLASCNVVRRLVGNVSEELLEEMAPVALERLPDLILEGGDAAEVLIGPVLRTLSQLLRKCPAVVNDLEHAKHTASFFLSILLRFGADSYTAFMAAEALSALIVLPVPSAIQAAITILAPALVSLLDHPEETPAGVVKVAIDLARGLVERSEAPLSPELHSLVSTILSFTVEDPGGELCEKGVDALASVAIRDPEFLASSPAPCRAAEEAADSVGAEHSAAGACLGIARTLLHWVVPTEESASLFAPRLLVALVEQLHEVLPEESLQRTLEVAAARFLTARTPTLSRQLILLFAQLLLHQPHVAVSLLTSTRLPLASTVRAYVRHTADGSWVRLERDPIGEIRDDDDGVVVGAVAVAEHWLEELDRFHEVEGVAEKLSLLGIARLLTLKEVAAPIFDRITPPNPPKWAEPTPLAVLLTRTLAAAALERFAEEEHGDAPSGKGRAPEPETRIRYEDDAAEQFVSADIAKAAGMFDDEEGGEGLGGEDDEEMERLRALALGDFEDMAGQLGGFVADMDVLIESDDEEEEGDEDDQELWSREHPDRHADLLAELRGALRQLNSDHDGLLEAASSTFAPMEVEQLHHLLAD